MELLFLGTGAGLPAKFRNVSSLALKLLDELNEVWLFDCGEGTQHQILHTTLKPSKITKIFITHLHGDHTYGLPGFLSSRSFQGGESPVTVYGPPGIRRLVTTSLNISKTRLTYPIHFKELDPEGGVLNFDRNWKVEYLPVEHNVLSIGYRITEPDQEGELLVDKLKEYNIPNGPIFGQLKRKEIVTLEDGTVLDGSDFVGPKKPGRVVTIIGDTRKCKNSEVLAKDADVLVHEATFGQEDGDIAYDYYHSTNVQAATIAKNANVNQLYLNHISARYIGEDCVELEEDAKKIHPKTKVVFDFDEYEIPRKSSGNINT